MSFAITKIVNSKHRLSDIVFTSMTVMFLFDARHMSNSEILHPVSLHDGYPQ